MTLLLFIVIFFRSWGVADPHLEEMEWPAIYFLNLTLFLLRDLCLILFLNLKEGARRADLAALIYLIIAIWFSLRATPEELIDNNLIMIIHHFN